MTSETSDLIIHRYAQNWEAIFPKGGKAKMAVDIQPFTQNVVGLKLAVPHHAKIGQSLKIHFVQRCQATRQIVGGVAVQVKVGRRFRYA